jgi:flavin reductase (DIM6/NTAB) family NADH-FMN oxidoreductase RutF
MIALKRGTVTLRRQEFRGVTAQFPSGVAIVITIAAGEPHATTASSFVAVSAEPPLVAVFFAAGARMGGFLQASRRFTINVIGVADHALARRFARPDRPTGWSGLGGVELTRRDPDPPVLAQAAAWLDCAVRDVLPLGDHVCFVGEPLAMGRDPEARPLLYYRGRFHQLGPSAAPALWSDLSRDDLCADW